MSYSLTSLSSSLPESVFLSSPSHGGHLVGDFSGWTAGFDILGSGCKTRLGGTLLVPLTVFVTPTAVTCQDIQSEIKKYEEEDDVYENLFMQGKDNSPRKVGVMLMQPKIAIYLKGAESFEDGLLPCLHDKFGTDMIFASVSAEDVVQVQPASTIPNGPYLVHLTSTYATLGPVYRVYRDTNMAFMNGLLPDSKTEGFRYATLNTMSDSTIGIPVPSRLYANDVDRKQMPFAGLRVTVKDIIDVKGVKTSMGNRAWFELYDAANATAPAVESLVKKGAAVIGKTKTAQFANADRPTADWVDYQ
jgi:hypothetical protein